MFLLLRYHFLALPDEGAGSSERSATVPAGYNILEDEASDLFWGRASTFFCQFVPQGDFSLKKHSNNVSHAVQEARPDALVSFGLLGDGAKGMKSQERVEAGQDEVGNLSPAVVSSRSHVARTVLCWGEKRCLPRTMHDGGSVGGHSSLSRLFGS